MNITAKSYIDLARSVARAHHDKAAEAVAEAARQRLQVIRGMDAALFVCGNPTSVIERAALDRADLIASIDTTD